MSEPPAWLPPLVVLSDYDGDWQRYLEAIYECFRQDFILSTPTYPHKRFALKRHPLLLGKEATFWHLISEGTIEANRLPDLRRCERIRWPRAIIERLGAGDVLVWPTERRGERRIQASLPDFSYLVVLADRGAYVLLWTAYLVEHEHRRRRLWQEYEAWRAKNG